METTEDIVLFDMDGTLTPPRRPITEPVVLALCDLLEHVDIGIVTGSGLDYLREQCNDPRLTSAAKRSGRKLWFLPCNGTQAHLWESGTWSCRHSVSMRKRIGPKWMNFLFVELLDLQVALILREIDLPFRGQFIQDRDSMVNWSPIGRSAGTPERAAFIEFDKRKSYRFKRTRSLERLQVSGDLHPELVFKLGGQTSIDIFPKGWDKTYSLRHFTDQNAWFVGDKCSDLGNDREIYEAVRGDGRGFQSEGPDDTVRIIRDKILPAFVQKSS